MRRTISPCGSASMSLAGCEIATKLPGTHASISRFTIALGFVVVGANCRTAISMTATGWLKSSVSAASARILSGSRRSASM